MKLRAVPALTDNYIWMIDDGHRALVIDPGEASPVEKVLQQDGLELVAILVTHRHADHIAGIKSLRSLLNGPVFGPLNAQADGITHGVTEGDVVDACGVKLDVWHTPGHTSDHISYVLHDHKSISAFGAPLLFCGDTLFSAGCGRIFDGTAPQLFHSLSRFSSLPANTLVCCTHEYTLSNLRFARTVEPSNTVLAAYEQQCLQRRQAGVPTLPSTIQTERAINPFLRCDQAQVMANARQHGAMENDALSVFTALRQWKNTYQA
ncbi:hydroxyacylglutathione hydrolase [Aquabacterium sp.]|uniref:hydroxyacylglutathione hydrolase n=1 Tax=Aquabacterium sp. TaxID=1872578 RepID=UPI0035AD88C8